MPDTQHLMSTIESKETIGLWAFIILIWKTLVVDPAMHGWSLIGAIAWTVLWTAAVPLFVLAEWKTGFDFVLGIVTALVGLVGTVFTTYILYDKVRQLWKKNRTLRRRRK